MIFPLTLKTFPSFWITTYPMAFSDTYFEMGISKKQGTKEWFVEHYFNGWDELIANWKKCPNINPVTLGDDYNLKIVVKNPTELFGMGYKKIKYFASDIFYEGLNANKVDDKAVSFWFVKQTDTRFVDDDVIVTFTLAMDYMHTCSDIIEEAVGDWKINQMHEQDWEELTIQNDNNPSDVVKIYTPKVKDARGILNCSDFCKTRDKKYLTPSIDFEMQSDIKTDITLIYCTFPQTDLTKIPSWGRQQTLLRFEDVGLTNVSISYLVLVVDNGELPYQADDENNPRKTLNQHLIEHITMWGGTVHSIEKTLLTDITSLVPLEEYDGIYFPNCYRFHTIDGTGDAIPVIEKKHLINEFDFSLKIISPYYKTDPSELMVDEIDVNNYPHLLTAIHKESLISLPEKKPYVLDVYSLFNKGNSLRYKTEEGGIDERFYLKSIWLQIYDVEYGGKLIYFENGVGDVRTSISNTSNIMDLTGSNNFPFAIDSYWTEMQTRRNQKQATLDNIEIDKRTAKTLNKMQTEENAVSGVTNFFKHITGAAGNILTGNLGGGISEAGGAMFGLIDDANKTVMENMKNSVQIKANYDKAMNSVNAEYDDLKMGTANIHPVGKISSQNILEKQFFLQSLNTSKFNINFYQLQNYANEINDIEKKLIAFNRNKFGNPVNYYLFNKKFIDLLTNKWWNYLKLDNFFEYAKKTGLPNDIVQVLSDQFASGLILLNLDSIEKGVVELDYNKNNYHLAYEDFSIFAPNVKITNEISYLKCAFARMGEDEENNPWMRDYKIDYDKTGIHISGYCRFGEKDDEYSIEGPFEINYLAYDWLNPDDNWRKVTQEDVEDDTCMTVGYWIRDDLGFRILTDIGKALGIGD